MRRKNMFGRILACVLCCVSLILGGCQAQKPTEEAIDSKAAGNVEETGKESIYTDTNSVSETASVTAMSIDKMFSNRDKEIGYDVNSCILIELEGNSISCENAGVQIDGSTATITKEGIYYLRGTLDNGSVVINATKEEKVQLILDNVTIQNASTAPIYVKKADKVFITLAPDSNNSLINTGNFVAIDDNNIDGAIFSKADLTLNGTGSLSVKSEKGHGIVSKDDLVITSGNYTIDAASHGLSGKDSIRIANGTCHITCGKDGLHSGNDIKAEKGFIYIEGGNLEIAAGDDGMHSEHFLIVAGGSIDISKSEEGLESKVVEIAGGQIKIVSNDDGINATDGSGEEFGFGKLGFGKSTDTTNTATTEEADGIYILISGGNIEVQAGGDGLDSNGALSVMGGKIYISGPEKPGNGSLDYTTNGPITGGEIIAAGSQSMAQNFTSDSTQCSILITVEAKKAGDTVTLKDANNIVLLSYTPTLGYDSVVVSSPLIKQGETYQITCGSESQSVTVKDIITGTGNEFGFGGGHGKFGDGTEGGKFHNRENFDPENMPEGFDRDKSQKPDKLPEERMQNMPAPEDMPEEWMQDMPAPEDMPEEWMQNMPAPENPSADDLPESEV